MKLAQRASRLILLALMTLSLTSLALVTNHPVLAVRSSTFIVTTTADSSSCPDINGGVSLRCAITDANTSPKGTYTIAFNIPPTIGSFTNNCAMQTIQGQSVLVCTIVPTSALPALTASYTTIDGYSQPGAKHNKNLLSAGDNAILTIQLDGGSAGTADGLLIQGSHDTVRGLSITNFSASGMAAIHIQGNNKNANAAQGTTIAGDFIGVAPDGVTAGPNDTGIYTEKGAGLDLIGGPKPPSRNLISGNNLYGVYDNPIYVTKHHKLVQYGNHNTIQGNYVGTDATGAAALNTSSNNGTAGIKENGDHSLIGGSKSGEGNIISGNTHSGLFANGMKDTVQANYIGTNAAGSAAVGNGINGNGRGEYGMCDCGSKDLVIGNVVSGNSASEEVGLESAGGFDTVQGNLIGTDATGKFAIPNDLGLEDSGGFDTVGGTTPQTRNVVSGNLTGNSGFLSSYGLESDGGFNTLLGNYIGTDITGSYAIPNGVGMENSGGDDTIGGTAPGDGNLISGNTVLGIWSDGGINTAIDNYIGTDKTGTVAIPNGPGGRSLVHHRWARHGHGRLQHRQVGPNFFTPPPVGYYADGGEDKLTGNVISGNNGAGVNSDGGLNTFTNNKIGTTPDGMTSLPNRGQGVNSSGGIDTFTGNVVSANNGDGIYISGGANTLTNNMIGTKADGITALPNQGNGVTSTGGADSLSGNVLSANQGNGVYVTSSITISGNFIGTGSNGSTALGNGINGVDFGSPTNPASGTVSNNTIANNALSGVLVGGGSSGDSNLHIAIESNQTFFNGGLGIDLYPEGIVNCNTSPPGPNDYTPCPVISGINSNGGTSTISGTACISCTVQVFTATNEQDDQGYGEGQTLLGTATADGSGNWTLTINQIQSGTYVTATATTPSGSNPPETSEFGLNVVAP